MNDILIFISSMLGILSVLFIIIMSKKGFSYTSLKDYIKLVENKTVLEATTGIIAAVLGVAFMVFVFGMFISEAKSAEWFDRGSVFVGIDYHNNGSVFCQNTSTGVSDKYNSNMGATVGIYKDGAHSWSGNYTHHSCAINPDVNTYDAIGFKYEWRIF